MHGREGEEWRRRRHMWPALGPGTAKTTAAAAAASTLPRLSTVPVDAAFGQSLSSYGSFHKDGRKIHIGDCALFRADNSPPFIGLIRWFAPGQEEHLKLVVNWLYRPSDISLAKGTPVEAAPNEVFYSFHRDEISAESLLHPCKVAFLRKGIELPLGVSSFVCRRVYDTTNKCLWWLTDQDYVKERQEEVDLLLDRTRPEMRAVVQPGGRSPKTQNGPSSTQLLKPGSDGGQNNSTSFPSHSRAKKRGDRGDQGLEFIKQECSVKPDDEDSNHVNDNSFKSEVAKITDKSGLINNDAVEKLVNIMQLERGERKIDLAGRVFVADVIAATDRSDCLGRFVQLRGVPMLDDWLQEAHKGKKGDGSSLLECDKSIEELLLALLRALDKLPIDLDALQTCNIGKSVNHLRSHKNSEIQKKARSLVDAWKKRVDAEMTKLEMARLNDAKSSGSSQAVSWNGKPGFPGVPCGGNRRTVSEIAIKGAITQASSCKSLPVRVGHGDSVMKSNAALSGSPKLTSTLPVSTSIGGKDFQSKVEGSGGTTELSGTTKEEKINGSSQCCSNDPAKNMGFSCKEEAKNVAVISMNAVKVSGGSRSRKSSNGFVCSGTSGISKDTGSGKSGSQNRGNAFDKAAPYGLSSERITDLPAVENGSQRLVVRFPNPVKSSANGSTPEEHSITGSRTSSPVSSEKNEHADHSVGVKADVCRANITEDQKMEQWQNDDAKRMVRTDDSGRSPADLVDEEHKNTHEAGRGVGASRAICSSAKEAETVSGKTFEASLSSINALIESCIKYSEVCVPLSGVDNLGINLLASVATGEISKSDLVPPFDSPGAISLSPAVEDPCTVDDVKQKSSSDNNATQVPVRLKDASDIDPRKVVSCDVSLKDQDEVQQNDSDLMVSPLTDGKSIVPSQDDKPTLDDKEDHTISDAISHQIGSTTLESKPANTLADVSAPLLTSPVDVEEDQSENHSVNQFRGRQKASESVADGLPECQGNAGNPSTDGNGSVDRVHEKTAKCSMLLDGGNDIDRLISNISKHEKETIEASIPLDAQHAAYDGLCDDVSSGQQPPVTASCPEAAHRNVDAVVASESAGACSDTVDGCGKENPGIMTSESQLQPNEHEKKDHTNMSGPIVDDKIDSSLLSGSSVTEENVTKDLGGQQSCSVASQEGLAMRTCENEQHEKPGYKAEEAKIGQFECPLDALVSNSSVPAGSAKLSFDLNEGLSGDEGNLAPSVVSTVQECLSTPPSMSGFTVYPTSSTTPISVTIAAPAKGPFMPPETLRKRKGEPGWKGSAATSAFRPAEPRKVLEVLPGASAAQSFDAAADRRCRPLLNFDLNVVDERVLEDILAECSANRADAKLAVVGDHSASTKSCGGLDLDLNKTDESTENGEFSASTIRAAGAGVPLLPVTSSTDSFSNRGTCVIRDFDLNNGPGLDGGVSEHGSRAQLPKGNIVPFLPSLRMNYNEGAVSSWIPPGNSFPAVAIPSFLPDRVDHAFPVVAAPGARRMFVGSAADSGAFGSELYRSPVLSSSPAVAFTPATAFSYPGLPFGTSFPLASTSFTGGSTTYADNSAAGGTPCFPAVPTPVLGAAPAQCVRPYLISLPEGGGSTVGGPVNIRKWGWPGQGLDLNAGPGSLDVESRDERLRLLPRQLPVANLQASAEEQARIYQAAGGILKRKEPDGGWDIERLNYKQPSWQ